MPVVVYKNISETPLDAVKRYKRENKVAAGQTVSYAGRLDPMAEGLLLLLIGDENKNRREFESLEKEYLFKVLFGYSTDSYDVMGLITEHIDAVDLTRVKNKLGNALSEITEIKEQEYPPYSSAVVAGKPLYWWARAGRLGEVIIPKRPVTISSLTLIGWSSVTPDDFVNEAVNRVKNTSGAFRQEDIINQWRVVGTSQTDHPLPLAEFRIVCSSGTYVRGLVHTLGRALNIPTLTYSIKRVRVGLFKV